VLGREEVSEQTRQFLQDSLVLVHGGMAQNVGPILEMVTEKYLLRSQAEWTARASTHKILDGILHDLHRGDIKALGEATTANFEGPLQTIVPWASNFYTETLIREVKQQFGADFWGFWMLGGMSGGGMGFHLRAGPQTRSAGRAAGDYVTHAPSVGARAALCDGAGRVRLRHQRARHWAELLPPETALLPPGYYAMTFRNWCAWIRAVFRPRAVANSITSPPPAARARAFGHGANAFRPPAAALAHAGRHRHQTAIAAGRTRLRRGAARTDSRAICAAGASGWRKPVAADERHPRCGAGDVVDAEHDLTEAMREQGLEALRNGQAAVLTWPPALAAAGRRAQAW
jgi:hypothetical protein